MKKYIALLIGMSILTSLSLAPTVHAKSHEDEDDFDPWHFEFDDDDHDDDDEDEDEDDWDWDWDFDFDDFDDEDDDEDEDHEDDEFEDDENFEDEDLDEDFEDEDEFEEEDFEKEKAEIISELDEEIGFLENAEVAASATKAMEALKEIADEDAFFDLLDETYDKLDAHYEENGHTEYWDFEDDHEVEEDWDFESEKKEILSELAEEVTHLENADLTAEIQKAIEQMKTMEEEDEFFDTLDTAYNKLDEHYEKNGYPEDLEEDMEDEMDFENMDEEELIEEINAIKHEIMILMEELSYLSEVLQALEQ